MPSRRLAPFWWEQVWVTISRSRPSISLVCGLLMLNTRCAAYASDVDTSLASEAPVGSAGSAVAGGGSFPGGSLAADSDRFYGGGGSASASPGIGGRADGGSSGATFGATSSAGQQAAGGGNSAGGPSTSAGAGDTVGEADGAASVPDYNLSRGRPATTDSEQSHHFHYAADGNDGDRDTRWCATNSKTNHYWEVDLGESFNLSALHVLWEKNVAYLFKVESSLDRTAWSIALDKTGSNSVAADQHHRLLPGTTGRYVRITVTGGLTTNVWASFYELEVFGH